MKQITDLLNEGVQAKHFPGASYCIIYKDGTLDCDFVGNKQLEPVVEPLKDYAIYDCASLTKVVSTTPMIMKLIETGKLSLETSVKDILPRFKHEGIKVSHLLTHSSGLPADVPASYTLRNRKELTDKIYAFDLINPIGEKVVYSDIGYMLLGFMIEKLTGLALDEYAKKVIFEPLGMTETSYRPDKEKCAPTELREDDVYNGYLQGLVHDEKSFALQGLSGHAGMFSTVKDLSKFILSILNNDEKILKKETVDLLFPCRIEDISARGNKLVRSYGWDKPTPGGTAGSNVSFEHTIVHTGFTGCNMWIEKEKGIGFVMLSNAVHPKRSLNKIIQYRHKIGNIIIPN